LRQFQRRAPSRFLADASRHDDLSIRGRHQHRPSDRRTVASALADKLGQQFVVRGPSRRDREYWRGRPPRPPPDGYTLLVTTLGPSVTNKLMYKSIGYDPDRAFVPSCCSALRL